MTERKAPTPNDALRGYGFSLLFLGLAVGGLGRSLHVSDAVHIAMSIGSGLLSLSAMVLFVKATKPSRRPALVLTVVAAVVALAAITFAVLHRT